MKRKNNVSVLHAFKSIIQDNHCKPTVIISDSDSTFLSNSFDEFVKEHHIIQNVVPIGDHHSLGIIDRFALTLKRILTKQREITKSSNWIDSFDKIINVYNKTDHEALGGLSPNEAQQDKNKQKIL